MLKSYRFGEKSEEGQVHAWAEGTPTNRGQGERQLLSSVVLLWSLSGETIFMPWTENLGD